MSMKKTLQRLDRTLDIAFQKDRCNQLSSELTEKKFDDIDILMERCETQIDLMRREMIRFEQDFEPDSIRIQSADRKKKIYLQMGDFRHMSRCVAILYRNFKRDIKPLMEVRNVRVEESPGTTIQIRRIERTYGQEVIWRFEILKLQTVLLTRYLDPGNGVDSLLWRDTTYFSEMLTNLNGIMRALENKLLEVCAINSDFSDFSDLD